VEVCNNGIDDNGDCQVDEGCTEICDNGIDDDGNSLTDCADPQCTASPLCSEICDNGIDDNANSLVDCYDPICDPFPACQCHDPVADSDGDGDVDMIDFAGWQRCHIVAAAFSQACICFDQDRDGDVDELDLTRLINCANGPSVPADPGCD
ncbi:MAG: hypothetical protein HY718_05680, partial [Planctomycetes bacterium]|nr:hypothetical protein [Planctomycetota bacterium]